MKDLPRRVLAILANLPLAIALWPHVVRCHWKLAFRVCNASSETVVDQVEAPEFYFQRFPEENLVLRFITWRWAFTLRFDHVISSPVFLGMLALLGISLMACTWRNTDPNC